ncbi:hypothetical protein C8R44DRAFT_883063 [Mycena epipterygia]|nr:hypothetical protein C8R44DRAFT_883063 [Mycena epipterygia]
MSGLDTIIGALLIGTWADSLLYSVEILQAVYYFRHFKNDSWMLKLLVLSAITIDTVSMLGNYACVYLYWPVILYLFSTGIVAALVQSFLVIRYWSLAKNVSITPILFCFIMAAIGGAFASAVTIATFPTYKDRGKVKIPATTWLVAEAVTDISIALALLFEFRKVKTSFQETKRRAHFLVNRLAALTIRTGAAGATIAAAVLIAYLINNESNGEFLSCQGSIILCGSYFQVPLGIGFCLGRVYCLTMLTNLNFRTGDKKWSGNETSSGGMSGTRGQRTSRARSKGSDGGIHVQVHIDNRQDFSTDSFKPNPGPNTSPGEDIEMAVQDSASYSSKRKQGLFAA